MRHLLHFARLASGGALAGLCFFALAMLLAPAPAEAVGFGRPTHMNPEFNALGCAGCHSGKGAPGTPLLRASKEQICFKCHGATSRGRSRGTDIESTLTKLSFHPVLETARFHRRGEKLPESDDSIFRHVSCFDCHIVHITTSDEPIKGVRGYVPGNARGKGLPMQGFKITQANEEYELCYLCHSDSSNLSPTERRISDEFSPENASYHPVETIGKNNNVTSLIRALGVSSTITCTDCHGNDDAQGPKGPHGSDYKPILLAKYNMDDGPETPKNYELCYMCHDRRSIIGNESFEYHRRHIIEENTSCHTCHNPHGSEYNLHLIKFNELVVFPSDTTGGPDYVPARGRDVRCFLMCHDADHSIDGVGENPWP